MPKYLYYLIVLLFQLICSPVFSQEMGYFHKIESIVANTNYAPTLLTELDSLKQTRRPADSKLDVLFNRGIDFEYKQQRIILVLNGSRYQLNLLTKNDTIYLSAIKFDDTFTPLYPKYKTFKIDTTNALKYLKLRNQFYNSNKTLNELKTELSLYEEYVLRGGDGHLETAYKKHLDSLVNRKDINELTNMLKSINCEWQTYGVTGFTMLKNKKVKISKETQRLIIHIKKRNSELVSCMGDICAVMLKAF